MTLDNNVRAAFTRWKQMLGDIDRNLRESVLYHLEKADPHEDNVHIRLAVDYVNQQMTALQAIIKQMGQPVTEPYYPLIRLLGIKDNDMYVPVKYWAEFLRSPEGDCAFCRSDDWNDPTTPIGKYLHENRTWAHTCPVCQGRAT